MGKTKEIKMRYLLLFLMLSFNAHADCQWRWDCTSGNCEQIPVCQSFLDFVPTAPLQLPPKVKPARIVNNHNNIWTMQCAQRKFCNYKECTLENICN